MDTRIPPAPSSDLLRRRSLANLRLVAELEPVALGRHLDALLALREPSSARPTARPPAWSPP